MDDASPQVNLTWRSNHSRSLLGFIKQKSQCKCYIFKTNPILGQKAHTRGLEFQCHYYWESEWHHEP